MFYDLSNGIIGLILEIYHQAFLAQSGHGLTPAEMRRLGPLVKTLRYYEISIMTIILKT